MSNRAARRVTVEFDDATGMLLFMSIGAAGDDDPWVVAPGDASLLMLRTLVAAAETAAMEFCRAERDMGPPPP